LFHGILREVEPFFNKKTRFALVLKMFFKKSQFFQNIEKVEDFFGIFCLI